MTPVVLAPGLGAAQEVVALLGAAALPLRVHARIAAFIDAYERVGLRVPTAQGLVARKFRGSPGKGEVVVWPLEDRHAPAIGRLRGARACSPPPAPRSSPMPPPGCASRPPSRSPTTAIYRRW